LKTAKELSFEINEMGRKRFGTIRRVFGDVVGPDDSKSSFPIVVAVRGIIMSIGLAYHSSTGEFEFSALLPEMPGRVSASDLQIFTISRDSQGLALKPVSISS
jgi:hypothetical protein